jgi:AcrR family transcriptional regulator
MTAATRLFIIQKSAPLFNKKGYLATSVADIMAATGLARVGIYDHFRSKNEIARAALEYSNQTVMNALEARLQEADTFSGQLDALICFYHNYTASPVIDGGCPILNAVAVDAVPGLREAALKGLNLLVDKIRQIILQGKTAGEFRKEIDASNEADLIVATIKGGIIMSQLSGNSDLLNRLLGQLRSRVGYYCKIKGYCQKSNHSLESDYLLPISLN